MPIINLRSFFFFPKVLECSFVHAKFLRGIFIMCVCVLVAQECPTLCDLMECSPPGFLCPLDSPGKNTRVGCHSLLQGIFLTQGLSLCLLHCRCILYHLGHQGTHFMTSVQSVQWLSRVRLFATPWTAAHQASLSITNSRSPPKPMSIQPSHPLSSPSPLAFNLSQHQGLFK